MRSDAASMTTARLSMRLVCEADAEDVTSVARLKCVSDCMVSIPHPYPEDLAPTWTRDKRRGFEDGSCFAFRIDDASGFCGVIEVRDIEPEHGQGELSFWFGPDKWGKGYATEAATAVLAFAFERHRLNRIVAFHMVRNPASGKVLAKLGFRREGLLRQRVYKWGVYEDVHIMAILRSDWSQNGTVEV